MRGEAGWGLGSSTNHGSLFWRSNPWWDGMTSPWISGAPLQSRNVICFNANADEAHASRYLTLGFLPKAVSCGENTAAQDEHA